MQPAAPALPTPAEAAREHNYLVARATNRAGRIAGLAKIGMITSALSTLGLALLRRRGEAGAGAALVASAAGIAFFSRTAEAD